MGLIAIPLSSFGISLEAVGGEDGCARGPWKLQLC